MNTLIIIISVAIVIAVSAIAYTFYVKLKNTEKKYRYILKQLDVTNSAFFALGKTPPFINKSSNQKFDPRRIA